MAAPLPAKRVGSGLRRHPTTPPPVAWHPDPSCGGRVVRLAPCRRLCPSPVLANPTNTATVIFECQVEGRTLLSPHPKTGKQHATWRDPTRLAGARVNRRVAVHRGAVCHLGLSLANHSVCPVLVLGNKATHRAAFDLHPPYELCLKNFNYGYKEIPQKKEEKTTFSFVLGVVLGGPLRIRLGVPP